MVVSMSIVIVGGSCGGLACAHALLKAGCHVTVFERASSITAAGAVSEAHPGVYIHSICVNVIVIGHT
jgi:2-polyprenyl-6-methoxyphenol hydroxylase-like FAD-dependent oxidoreductase